MQGIYFGEISNLQIVFRENATLRCTLVKSPNCRFYSRKMQVISRMYFGEISICRFYFGKMQVISHVRWWNFQLADVTSGKCNSSGYILVNLRFVDFSSGKCKSSPGHFYESPISRVYFGKIDFYPILKSKCEISRFLNILRTQSPAV